MQVSSKGTVVAIALSGMLSLSACGGTTTQDQSSAQSSAQSEPQTQLAGMEGASTTASSGSQSINLEGVGNARQLGGYVGADGKVVKDGVLLRTASLGEATKADIDRLKNTYNLAEIIDLRTDVEAEYDPEIKIDGVKNLNLLIIDEEAMSKSMESLSNKDLKKLGSGNLVKILEVIKGLGIVGDQMYVNFLSHDAGKQGYAQMFRELLELPEGQSLLFHCTQGKDRTGCAAMLILAALGVDEQTILDDYMLTNEFNAELIEQERQEMLYYGVKESQLDDIMIARDQVFPETMTNALEWLKAEYGSPMGYITKELGVTEEEIAQLQSKFLV